MGIMFKRGTAHPSLKTLSQQHPVAVGGLRYKGGFLICWFTGSLILEGLPCDTTPCARAGFGNKSLEMSGSGSFMYDLQVASSESWQHVIICHVIVQLGTHWSNVRGSGSRFRT